VNKDAAKTPDPAGGELTPAQYEKILGLLDGLTAKLRPMAVLLADSAGRILAQKMGSGWRDARLDGLAALAAGSFSASGEMARLLGEGGRFRMLLHEGEHRNLFLCAVTPAHFLVVVFESGVALGMVRLFSKQTLERLVSVLEEADSAPGDLGRIFDKNFQSLLDKELDRSLAENR
jgi:predicted regulator of Ras-like GTPase activity (Roadblock/LC7/MglB family)